ncbi:MAG TPA: hypothetical protein VIW64_12140 [Pyrinomonadaceae bacterium]|jgi:hypothetical protein
MTQKTFLLAGALALAITTTSAISTTRTTTEAPTTTALQPAMGMQSTNSRSHYPWQNSYKAVVDQTAAVVQGIVTDVRETYDEKQGPRTLVTLSRLSVLWGEFRAPNVTLRLFGGSLPRRGRVDEVHIPKFVRGKRYVVFLSNREWRLSPVTAHQAFIIERVQNKDILVTTDGHAVHGIDDATGPIRKFVVHLIPDQIDDNFVPKINPRITARMVAGAYSPAEFAASLKAWAKLNSVSVSGTFTDQPYTTGNNWRVNKAVPDRIVEASKDKDFEPRPGARKDHNREEKPCWNRATPYDADPKDRSGRCSEGGEK